jgi:hypothetical protein
MLRFDIRNLIMEIETCFVPIFNFDISEFTSL